VCHLFDLAKPGATEELSYCMTKAALEGLFCRLSRLGGGWSPDQCRFTGALGTP